MTAQTPFRFAAQISRPVDGTARSWADTARRVEDAGYSSILMPDHFGEQFAPGPALAAAATATDELRVGTLVFDNDYRHPLMLTKEIATLDVLSEGRVEIGLGAGWMLTDYEQSGMPYDKPAVRIDRFIEGLTVIKGLLSTDGAFSFEGDYYKVTEHAQWPQPVQRPHPPIIIGGGGKRMLTLAAQHADIVSINVDLRGGTAGPEVAPNASPEMTRRKVAWVKEAAGDRFDQLELNTLVGFVMITDDRTSLIEAMAPTFGLDPSDAEHVPLALIGTLEQIEEELQWRRTEYGISYFAIESEHWEALSPVVAKLAGT